MNKIKLLMVDDEESFLSPLVKRLNKRDYKPETANSGTKCLNLMAENTFDVLVLDVKMPDMSGLEVLNTIKDRYPETEVILLTGQANVQDGIKGIKSGAFDYLSKPVELDHLLSKINQAYEKIQRLKEKKEEIAFKAKIQKKMESAERLASIGTLAVGIAHEINNPLAIINESAGWLKMLLKRYEQNGKINYDDFLLGLEKIESGVERASKITHQILGFVRENQGIYKELDPIPFLQECIQFVSKEAKRKNILIDLKKNSVIVHKLWTEPFQLRQVLINILINAIHATPVNGKIYTWVENSNNVINFSIKDTGDGIPEENLEKIFEPFFTTKTQGKGTGLGLFISKGIIQKLDGIITLESKAGIGTTFSVVLPLTNKNQ